MDDRCLNSGYLHKFSLFSQTNAALQETKEGAVEQVIFFIEMILGFYYSKLTLSFFPQHCWSFVMA